MIYRHEIARILRDARDLIIEPEHWCKHTSAKNAEGMPCLPRSDEAMAWCATGAICHVTPPQDEDLVHAACFWLQDACNALTGEPEMTIYNDQPSTQHANIMLVYDYAIKNA